MVRRPVPSVTGLSSSYSGWMPFIEVDPAELGRLARCLWDAVEAAREVKDGSEALKDMAAGAGDGDVEGALRSFLGQWSYGCGLLAEGGERLSSCVSAASRAYVEVEDAVVRAVEDG